MNLKRLASLSGTLGLVIVSTLFSLMLGSHANAAEIGPHREPRGRAAALQASCAWTGVWETNWGDMELVQQGNQVIGTYTHDQGKIAARAQGLTITGTWSESPSYAPPNDAGDVEFTMTPDCNSFSGRWRYGSQGDWADWSGNSSRTQRTPQVTLPTATTAAVRSSSPAGGALVVNAVDNDPENKLWDCETRRVPFGNEDSDVLRCITFRYAVPSGGIKSAFLSMAIKPLGGLQDTDALVVATGKPNPDCDWGHGKMPGCVALHGGFQGPEKSLNLDPLNIACDPSIQGSPENQQAVLAQFQTGVVHMMLEDDTAVFNAQLVLNGGPPAVPCGASLEPFEPRPAVVANAAGPLESAANTILTGTANPPPPEPAAVATAAAAGTVALAAYAVLNGWLGNLSTTGLLSAPGSAPGSAPPASRSPEAKAEVSSRGTGAVDARDKSTPGARDRVESDVRDKITPDVRPDKLQGTASSQVSNVPVEQPPRAPDAAVASGTRFSDSDDETLRDALDKVKEQIEGLAEAGESAWKCANCGRENRAAHHFCVKCGTAREAEG